MTLLVNIVQVGDRYNLHIYILIRVSLESKYSYKNNKIGVNHV